jgi:hypothetical protein
MLGRSERRELRTLLSGLKTSDPLLAWQLRPVWRSTLARMRANRAETAKVRYAELQQYLMSRGEGRPNVHRWSFEDRQEKS